MTEDRSSKVCIDGIKSQGHLFASVIQIFSFASMQILLTELCVHFEPSENLPRRKPMLVRTRSDQTAVPYQPHSTACNRKTEVHTVVDIQVLLWPTRTKHERLPQNTSRFIFLFDQTVILQARPKSRETLLRQVALCHALDKSLGFGHIFSRLQFSVPPTCPQVYTETLAQKPG